jgi:hypothetical protein
MFIDNYFDDEDIDVYEPDRESPEQILDNPLGAGNAANKSALDPRLYFLQLLQIRSRRVSQEWLNVAELLDARIKSAVSIVVPLTSMWPQAVVMALSGSILATSYNGLPYVVT